MTDRPSETPIPPWEQELAAEALAELKRGEVVDGTEQTARTRSEVDGTERTALKVADSSMLIAEVDRMIADKRAELERMQRLPNTPLGLGRDAGARGLTLNELGKPACIVFLLLVIVAAGLLLNWMAGQITSTLKERPLQQQHAVQEATDVAELESEPEPEEIESRIPMP